MIIVWLKLNLILFIPMAATDTDTLYWDDNHTFQSGVSNHRPPPPDLRPDARYYDRIRPANVFLDLAFMMLFFLHQF